MGAKMRMIVGAFLVLLAGLALFGPGDAAVQAAKEGGQAGAQSVASTLAIAQRIDREIEDALAEENEGAGAARRRFRVPPPRDARSDGRHPSADRATAFLDSTETDISGPG